MIPLLYEKDGINKIGELSNCIECLVEEERNGLFELTIVYHTNDEIFNSLEEENIIICNANDTLKSQKFRIYMTKKLMSNRIEVYARHVSFDLAYDTVDNIDITNQSCEYALNTIFRQSQFSTNYRGHSDIINAQDYKMSNTNCISAIAGEKGSIIDTYGTGAEILRDNTDIHVLNRRGNDNEVTIEYAKNLTGFELEEDFSELVTRINAIAKYTDSETNEEVLVEAKGIDSPLISNYSHPYIAQFDYSDKFQDKEKPTKEKLIELAKKEYSVNNKDKPKQNFKIEFIPLSKCVGYEDLEDKISLCDTVTIIDTRYGVNTKAKVIRVVFNVLKDRYESMELGEPRTTLGDIIGNGSTEEGKPGPPGPPGPPGADGDIGDFPDSLPSVPVLSAKVYGFATIELSWTFENKVYYQYELYASKTKDFTPNTFDLIHQGQTSTFLFQAEPNETWYFRVCAINSHGNRTDFSTQVTVTTTKIEDLSNYVQNAAIGDALIGELNLGRGWFGQLRGNYIDAKQLSVTDGNGKRTLDIDSFGNVNLDVNEFKISNKKVYTTDETDNAINGAISKVGNLIPNGDLNEGTKYWVRQGLGMLAPTLYKNERFWSNVFSSSDGEHYVENIFNIEHKKVYNFSMLIAQYSSTKKFYRIKVETKNKNSETWNIVKEFTGETLGTKDKPQVLSYTFESPSDVDKCRIWIGKLNTERLDMYISEIFMNAGISYAKKSEVEILDDKISLKVSENDFGTLIEQNAYAVKIAWNNNSRYVQFEDGGLAIYNGSVSESQKRAFFDEKGNHFWRDGYYLGKIGTNNYTDDTSLKGIVFDLENKGAYMTWAAQKTASSPNYTMVWTYTNKAAGNYSANRLHAGADIDMHNYYLRNVNFEGGGINGTLVFTQIVSMNSNGTAGRWYNNSKLVFQNGILIDATWGDV